VGANPPGGISSGNLLGRPQPTPSSAPLRLGWVPFGLGHAIPQNKKIKNQKERLKSPEVLSGTGGAMTDKPEGTAP